MTIIEKVVQEIGGLWDGRGTLEKHKERQLCRAGIAIAAVLKITSEEGWRLVRIGTTEEMVLAGDVAGLGALPGDVIEDIYRAMLAAAPEFEVDE